MSKGTTVRTSQGEIAITPEEEKKIRDDYLKLLQDINASHQSQPQELKPCPPLVYCMTIYEERMEQVLTCLRRVRPYVDRCIVAVDDSVTDESKKKLEQWGCKIVFRHWDDHFSKQRNAYLDQVLEGEWVLVSDPDELYSQSFMDDLKKIIPSAEAQGINSLCINAHDITTELDGTVTKTESDWFKQLIFKFEEGVRYVGCVHETLLPGIHGWRPANLDKRYYYEHYKNMIEVKERGARNVYCGGGGNNVRERNPMWRELREVCGRLGLFIWPDVREYVRKGKLDSQLKKIIIKHRNDSGWDWENESRDWFLWVKALHPKQFKKWESKPKPPSAGSPPEIMAYVEEQYLKVLGRNADDGGKQAYTQAIIHGKIKREDLPKILMESQEYKEKHPTP